MSKAKIDASDTRGSGSSVMIYETPDYDYDRRGAHVMHGGFMADPSLPGREQTEVVELGMPYVDIRVKAEDVRLELRALLAANKAWIESGRKPDKLDDRHRGFEVLRVAILGVACRLFTVEHFEKIAQAAFDDGVRQGKRILREEFRALMDPE